MFRKQGMMMRKNEKEVGNILKNFKNDADAVLYEYFKNNRYPKKAEKQRLAEKTNVTIQYVVNFFYNARSRIRRMEKQEAIKRQAMYKNTRNESAMLKVDKSYLSYMNQGSVLKFRGYQNDLYISEPRIESFLLLENDPENSKNLECDEKNCCFECCCCKDSDKS